MANEFIREVSRALLESLVSLGGRIEVRVIDVQDTLTLTPSTALRTGLSPKGSGNLP